MWPFNKRKKDEDEPKPAEAELDAEGNLIVPVASSPPPDQSGGGGGGGASSLEVGKLTADIEKLKAQFTTFYEIQKSTTERFSMINQQIGELRTMMIDRDKSGQLIEAKATQAIDLVKTVQPDKLMIEMRKSEGKIEALRANIESTENIINNVVNELKDVKSKIMIFRGMEQVIQLNEEAKKELMDIKKVGAIVERHADKVETIFSEMQKKFSDFVKFADTVKDLDKGFKQISSDFDSIKVRMGDLSSKKEVENLITKFDDFEKYTSSVMKLIDHKFEKMQAEFTIDFKKKFEDTDKLLKGFETLAMKTPDLNKYFDLLTEEEKKTAEKQQHAQPQPEKLKEMGEDGKVEVPKQDSMMDKVTGAVSGTVSGIMSKIKK